MLLFVAGGGRKHEVVSLLGCVGFAVDDWDHVLEPWLDGKNAVVLRSIRVRDDCNLVVLWIAL